MREGEWACGFSVTVAKYLTEGACLPHRCEDSQSKTTGLVPGQAGGAGTGSWQQGWIPLGL